MEEYLIVGLGNPGAKYEKTRHNLGFVVVEALAKQYGLIFKRGWRIQGKVASGVIEGHKVHLLLPSTFMNLSGTAVSRAVRYFNIELSRLLVVVDEVYLKAGVIRLRPLGGAGGHNGLKNIDALLGTQEYPRLRMGVGPLEGDLLGALEDYVLAQFTPDEQGPVDRAVANSLPVITCWLSKGIEAASQLAGELNNRFT